MSVLDASAVLAFLFREPGHERVAAELASSSLSAVNLSEVLGRFARDGHDVHLVARRLVEHGVEIVPFEEDDAALAARLRPTTDPLGLSLGDRACLALAQARGVPALTADHAWCELSIGVDIVVIR